MAISTAQFSDLTKNAMVQWEEARKEFNSVRQSLYNIINVSEKTSEYSNISSTPTARRRSEGDDAYKGTLKQGYTKNFSQSEIALQVDVTKQLRMFDKYDEIMKRMRQMGRSAERRMELDAASLLSYAWATSYTNLDGETVTTSTPDGLSLINPSHTANGSSNTFSNEISSTHKPISVDVLEELEELGNNFIDEADGRSMPANFDSIITGRHAPTVHTVKRILLSDRLQGTADNDKNDFYMYNHIIVPFLDLDADETRNSDKARYCFLASLGNMDDNGFVIEQSQGIQFEAPEQVFESSTWQYMTTALYDFGTIRAGFLAATKGDGSAV